MVQSVGVDRHIARAAHQAPYLERADEQVIARRWRDGRDEAALHALAQSHMRLVISIAARFRHYGLPMPDLIQEGHVGLLEAAARFEPDRDIRFSTYAMWWIRASVQDYVLRNWSIVRGGTSSAQKSLFFNLRRLRARLAQSHPDTSSAAAFVKIASALGVNPADVQRMDMRLSGSDVSLNGPVGDGDAGDAAERGDFLVDDNPLPDEAVGNAIDGGRRLASLRAALGSLNVRELRIVNQRRLSEDAATLEDLGVELGISKERVRQIEARALEKLRGAMLGEARA